MLRLVKAAARSSTITWSTVGTEAYPAALDVMRYALIADFGRSLAIADNLILDGSLRTLSDIVKLLHTVTGAAKFRTIDDSGAELSIKKTSAFWCVLVRFPLFSAILPLLGGHLRSPFSRLPDGLIHPSRMRDGPFLTICGLRLPGHNQLCGTWPPYYECIALLRA